jgi:serine/threonine protein kinase
MVMEKSWGSVSDALHLGPLTAIASIRIAEQIASALMYLRGREIQHGAIDLHNVLLMDTPFGDGNVVAKLTGFGNAKLNVRDIRIFAIDVHAYGVFTSNLFVTESSSLVRFDMCTLALEQERIKFNLEALRTDYPELAAVLLKMVSLELTIAEKGWYELHEILQSNTREHSEQRAGPLARPAPRRLLPTSAPLINSSHWIEPESRERSIRL